MEIHVRICKLLSLKDCIAYMHVSAITHDAVLYVFAHRRVLDFETVLDQQKTIALHPALLMDVLYAHSRTELIINFCLNASFTLFDEFTRYFNLYWAWRLIQKDADSSSSVVAVGHPSGHLRYLGLLGHFSGGSTMEQALFLVHLWNSNQDWLRRDIYLMYDYQPYSVTLNYTYPHFVNWSTIDIDAPYAYSRRALCYCPLNDGTDDIYASD